MVCYTNKHNIPFEIDDEDWEMVKQHKWCTDGLGYVITRIDGNLIRLHRFILNNPYGKTIDHIDGNGMNNKRSNLRVCTQGQNLMNQKPQPNKSSKYKGVRWHKASNAWSAQIKVNRKSTHLGTFDSESEAAIAYNMAATNLFGSYARLNNVEEITI